MSRSLGDWSTTRQNSDKCSPKINVLIFSHCSNITLWSMKTIWGVIKIIFAYLDKKEYLSVWVSDMAACLRSGSASKYIYNRVAGHPYHASTSEKKPNVWTLKSPITIINCTKSKLIFWDILLWVESRRISFRNPYNHYVLVCSGSKQESSYTQHMLRK